MQDKFGLKSQSAMEYLMTYGWTILMVAVVLGVLFQFGVFTAGNFAPRAAPGNCKVLRTTAAVSLVGVCSGQLPQYVASFPQQYAISGTSATYVNIGNTVSLNFLNAANAITVSAWVYPTSFNAIGGQQEYIAGKLTYPSSGWWMTFRNYGSFSMYFDVCNTATCYGAASPATFGLNQWVHVVGVSNGATVQVYVNGALGDSQPAATLVDSSASFMINNPSTGPSAATYVFNGMISNVQIYNTSLSANEILGLYQEGIGGAPIRPQNVVGWWPLNANGNDYSGNMNNGVPTGVYYTTQYGK